MISNPKGKFAASYDAHIHSDEITDMDDLARYLKYVTEKPRLYEGNKLNEYIFENYVDGQRAIGFSVDKTFFTAEKDDHLKKKCWILMKMNG